MANTDKDKRLKADSVRKYEDDGTYSIGFSAPVSERGHFVTTSSSRQQVEVTFYNNTLEDVEAIIADLTSLLIKAKVAEAQAQAREPKAKAKHHA